MDIMPADLVFPLLVVILLAELVGLAIFHKVLGFRSTLFFVTVTLMVTLAVTSVRYALAVTNLDPTDLTSDTYRYLLMGSERAALGWPTWGDLFASDGTMGTIAISQLFFRLLGPSWLVVYVAGSLVGLVGCWLIAAAIVVVVQPKTLFWPLLAVLFPSSLYWSSSFGKEAFSFLLLGLGLYTVISWNVGRIARAYVSMFSAALLGLIIRPELAAVAVLGVLASVAFIGAGENARPRLKVMVVSCLALGGLLILMPYLGLGNPLGDLVSDLGSRYDRTSIGDFRVAESRRTGLLGLVEGLPTAIFRPWPWEGGIKGLGSSFDSLLILYVGWRFWKNRGLTYSSLQWRALIYSLIVFSALTLALAGYGNIGLLARMRSMAIPFLIVVAAILTCRALDRDRSRVTTGKIPGSAHAGQISKPRSVRQPRASQVSPIGAKVQLPGRLYTNHRTIFESPADVGQ